MSDEMNSDIHSSTPPRKFSTGDNDELIHNGDHHDDSSDIQLSEPTEKHHNETEFTEETVSIDHSHNESVNNFDNQIPQDSFQIDQNSFDQSNVLDNQDDPNLFSADIDTTNNFHLPTPPHEDKPDELK